MKDNIPWTEKYRPKTFDGVVGNVNTVSALRGFVESKNFNHILLSGIPGIGKTTLGLVIVNELFADLSIEDRKKRYIEHNASDSRGIDFVRDEIKDYCQHSAKLRIIILDEADELTKPAQDALKRTLEKYPNCKILCGAC